MAASANPSASGAHSNGNNNNNGDCNGGVPEIANGAVLRRIPGLSLYWTHEEQSTLEDLLTQFASETNIVRYARISQALRNKTVRDVAIRCRWMNK